MGPLLFGVKRLLVGEPESFDEEEKETPNSQTQNKQSERKRGLFVIVWLFGGERSVEREKRGAKR